MPKKEFTVQNVSKMTLSQCKKAYEELAQQYQKIISGAYCHHCGKFLPKEQFYIDVNNASGVTNVCKRCAYIVATNFNENTKEGVCTRDSIIEALRLLNKPFIQNLYESSIGEVNNEASGKTKNNVWNSYIKNVQSLQQYYAWQFSNSDYGTKIIDENTGEEKIVSQNTITSEDIEEMYSKNKKSVLRMLGYDPFAYEEESDKPLLYSKLVNYFDDSLKDDGFKLEAVIEIVQTFKDVKHINDTLAQYTKRLQTDPNVIATIKALTETKKNMLSSALALAKDNGISENNNNKKSKGAGTLSGLLKEMSEMDLDDIEINTFDYETNLAIEDIMTRNHQNQLRQLNPDENDWEKEVIHQKKLIFNLQKERDNAVELCRLLRKENKDLKDYMREQNLIDESDNLIDG